MLTEEQAGSAYELATDGCRHSLLGMPDNARKWQRIKPDEEVHALAEFDYEEGVTWNEPLVTTPPLHLCSALVIQPLAPFARPSETDPVAAM